MKSPQQPQRVNRWIWITIGIVFILFILVKLVSVSGSAQGLSLGDKVGIIKLEGPIFSSEKTVKHFNEFLDRSDVKAIVLRINSPGGAVAPSQEIYEKVKRVNKIKPVVVSIGSMAASGGYYAALGSEIIVANRGSVTGSIGVIMEYPVAVDLLSKIGLKFETIKSVEMKDIGSPSRDVTDKDREVLKKIINDMHNQFVEDVSHGRNMDLEKTISIADGRVYTGKQSYEIGLVDTLGTFEDAIMIAGKLGNIPGKPKTVHILKKRKLSIFDILFGDVEQTTSSWFRNGPAFRWKWE